MTRAGALAAAAVLLLAGGGIGLAACGGGEGEEEEGAEATSEGGMRSTIPESLRVVESRAEDTIDFMLNGDRAKAIEAAKTLDDAAQGQAADDLARAGIPAATIERLRARTSSLEAIAAEGKPVAVALAANRVLGLVPGFFAAYSNPVPPEVLRLDYLDFEIELEALAGNRERTVAAVNTLQKTWNGLRDQVAAAGGVREAEAFTAHVDSVQSLLASGSDRQIADEARHGLELVDKLEGVYTGRRAS